MRFTNRRLKRLTIKLTLPVLAALLAAMAPQAAQAGFAEALSAYDAGNYGQAFAEWMKLGQAGDAAAQRNIGQMYRLGQGVAQNDAEAVKWYRKAAEQGLSRAQANLGMMYLLGRGTKQDYAEAARWFARAAAQGHVISMYNLGQLYEQGLGVKRDLGRAIGWYNLAARAGHAKSKQRLSDLVAADAADGRLDDMQESPLPPAFETSDGRQPPTPAANNEKADNAPVRTAEVKQPPKPQTPAAQATTAKTAQPPFSAVTPENGKATEKDIAGSNEAASAVAAKTETATKTVTDDAPSQAPDKAASPAAAPTAEATATLAGTTAETATQAAAETKKSTEGGFFERLGRLIGLEEEKSTAASPPAAGTAGTPPPADDAAATRQAVKADLNRQQPAEAAQPPVRQASAPGPEPQTAETTPADGVKPSGTERKPGTGTSPSVKKGATARIDWKTPPQKDARPQAPVIRQAARQPAISPNAAADAGSRIDTPAQALAAEQAGRFSQAASYWLRRARAGDPQAAYHAGRAFLEGKGLPRDKVMAYVWWSRAASAGNAEAARDIEKLRASLSLRQLSAARRLLNRES